MSTLLIGGNGLIGTRLTAFILPAKSIRAFITFRAT